MRKSPFLLLGLLALGAKAQALDFNFITDGTMDPQALAGFQQAGSIWSSLFTDNVTINVKVGYQKLSDPNIIGQTGSTSSAYNYSDYRSDLIGDATSTVDASATASLVAGTTYGFETNATTTSSQAFHAATASTVLLTNANAKAVGLLSGNAAGVDAQITFNSDFAFDLDRTDGIAANKMDFVGVAAHEIGHALGFDSGVDTLDYYYAMYYYGYDTLHPDSFFRNSHTALDLFRYANYGSAATPDNQRDWSLYDDSTAPYTFNSFLSFDGGTTSAGLMSSGSYFGDGWQASHWKDDGITGNLLGIMDPNTDFGNLMVVSQNDINAFDAIGWNVRPAPVPEPATCAALGLGAMAFLRRQRRS